VLDLGSGGGVPGLVLAERWSEVEITLLDAQARRVRFLDAAVAELGWGGRVVAIHGRAEELGRAPGHRGAYDLVTSRSFGPPAVTAECGGPFLRLGGVLVVAEPPGAPERWPAEGLAVLGLRDEGTVSAGDATVRRLRQATVVADRFPRRPGLPARRPLF
jgi:16S rRNA (guanine527-N7)-methyltransferase